MVNMVKLDVESLIDSRVLIPNDGGLRFVGDSINIVTGVKSALKTGRSRSFAQSADVLQHLFDELKEVFEVVGELKTLDLPENFYFEVLDMLGCFHILIDQSCDNNCMGLSPEGLFKNELLALLKHACDVMRFGVNRHPHILDDWFVSQILRGRRPMLGLVSLIEQNRVFGDQDPVNATSIFDFLIFIDRNFRQVTHQSYGVKFVSRYRETTSRTVRSLD